MVVAFKNKSGETIKGVAISRGWFSVDGEESFEIKVSGRANHAIIPVARCEAV